MFIATLPAEIARPRRRPEPGAPGPQWATSTSRGLGGRRLRSLTAHHHHLLFKIAAVRHNSQNLRSSGLASYATSTPYSSMLSKLFSSLAIIDDEFGASQRLYVLLHEMVVACFDRKDGLPHHCACKIVCVLEHA